MPDCSVHMAFTSPPYYGLRDYKIPPSTWGGDPACEHEFAEDSVVVEQSENVRWQHVAGGAGRGNRFANAGEESNRHHRTFGRAGRGFCVRCGAWCGALGLEPDWRMYLEHVVEVFREVRRVLRRDGTLWLNVGDSYASGSTRGHGGFGTSGPRPAGGGPPSDSSTLRGNGHRGGGPKLKALPPAWSMRPELGETSQKRRRRADRDPAHAGKHGYALNTVDPKARAGSEGLWQPNRTPQHCMKPKDRMMMPARVAIALQEDGWWLRDEIVWQKPNPMPSSVEDRTTPAHEMLYVLSRSARYYYDNEAIKELFSPASLEGLAQKIRRKPQGWDVGPGNHSVIEHNNNGGHAGGAKFAGHADGESEWEGTTRNRRSVWTIATEPFPEAHFATFPTALVKPGVMAGMSERGCCRTCAAPWRRICARSSGKGSWHDHVADSAAGMRQCKQGQQTWDTYKAGPTLGWWPPCRCEGIGELPPYPRKPRRPEGQGDAERKAELAAWERAVAEVDARRALLCDSVERVKTAPAVVLDPFGGSGTVGLVADALRRDAVLVDASAEYSAMARRRVEGPLFAWATPPLPIGREAAR
jgi:DNA modification methylase